MVLINLEKVFANAVINNNIEKVENILLTSDAINEVIKNFCQKHDAQLLKNYSKSFKSKGLITTVESLIEKYKTTSESRPEDKSSKVILTHKKNIQRNEDRYLQHAVLSKQVARHEMYQKSA